tara:strand:- start:4809 stop:4991 length:183 start_codon:yes stop_codon:yes gene_type:complete
MATYIELMRVKDFWVGIEDHGITSALLYLEGDGIGVGFGGYALGGEERIAAMYRGEREGP